MRGHPVAAFGRVAAGVERVTYRDSRAAGAVHVGALVGAVGLLGAALQRIADRGGPPWSIAATAAAPPGRRTCSPRSIPATHA
ncbi:hypothetical protein [Mycobacterium sp. E1386]|uniref:hypothetical protein n=1 Tax=Mycobacterium sp. E1386 TaxID=1834126 RepID=UPI0035135A58